MMRLLFEFYLSTDIDNITMRYTQYRGLTQVTNWVKLKFAAMNLKKLATWRWNDRHHLLIFHAFFCEYAKNPVAA